MRLFLKVRCYIRSEYSNGWLDFVAAPIKFTDILNRTGARREKAPAADIPDVTNTIYTNMSEALLVQTRRAKLENR